MDFLITQKDVTEVGRYLKPIQRYPGNFIRTIQAYKIQDLFHSLGGKKSGYGVKDSPQYSFNNADFNNLLKELGMEDKDVSQKKNQIK